MGAKVRRRLVNYTLVERIAAYTQKSDGCWEWLAARDQKGYGTITVDGRTKRAHRVAYELAVGTIPAGKVLDHKCHNRGCVRPDHLAVVTNKQNMENLSGARVDSRSGIRGVYAVRDGKWRADVRHNGRRHFVGHFASALEAERAVVAKRNELFTNNLTDRGRNVK